MERKKNSSEKIFSIVFFGSGEFGIPILDSLKKDKNFEIQKVITAHPKKAGRKRVSQKTQIEIFAEKNDLEILNLEKREEIINGTKDLDFDFLVAADFGSIIPKETFSTSKIASVCIHPSLLPKYRGASPIQNQILKGEKISGVTIFLLAEKLDAGDMISKKEVEIKENENYFSLSEKLSKESAKLTLETLKDFAEGKITPEVQEEKNASFCKKIKKKDGEIFIEKDSLDEILREFRAFKKWPGIFIFHKRKRIKLLDIDESKTKDPNKIIIQTHDKKLLEIKRLQLEGKKELSAEDFLKGNKDFFSHL